MRWKEKFRFYWRARRLAADWDPAEVVYLRNNLKPGQTAIDIGTHKGAYVYWMRKRVGESGQVHGFEPQDDLYEYLVKLVGIYGWKNVQINHAGLGSERGTMALKVPGRQGDTSPGATFSDDNVLSGKDYFQYDVEVYPLDDYVAEREVGEVAFIKIDVEGFEPQVLAGAAKTIDKFKPDLLIECEQRHHEQTPILDVFSSVLSNGYRGYFFDLQKLTELNAFSIEKHQKVTGDRYWDQPWYCNNFLFIHENCLADRVV